MDECSIFMAALDCEAPEARAAFLDGACHGDTSLRRRIEALLRSHEQADGFLGKSAPSAWPRKWQPKSTRQPATNCTS
jgi:hypothetical protein